MIGFIGIVWPINDFVTSFLPVRSASCTVAMVVGTLPFLLSDEWT